MIAVSADRVRIMLDDVFTMWGGMHAVHANHARCLAHVDEVIAAFRDGTTVDDVVGKLMPVEGIGATIATGVLWAFDPAKYVPFDKKTTGYCVSKGWLRVPKLRLGYEKICRRIVEAAVGEGKPHKSIRALVGAAEDLPEDFWVSPEW